MKNQKDEQHSSQCQSQCEDQFIRCTARTCSGCVEELRLCRDTCRKL